MGAPIGDAMFAERTTTDARSANIVDSLGARAPPAESSPPRRRRDAEGGGALLGCGARGGGTTGDGGASRSGVAGGSGVPCARGGPGAPCPGGGPGARAAPCAQATPCAQNSGAYPARRRNRGQRRRQADAARREEERPRLAREPPPPLWGFAPPDRVRCSPALAACAERGCACVEPGSTSACCTISPERDPEHRRIVAYAPGDFFLAGVDPGASNAITVGCSNGTTRKLSTKAFAGESMTFEAKRTEVSLSRRILSEMPDPDLPHQGGRDVERAEAAAGAEVGGGGKK